MNEKEELELYRQYFRLIQVRRSIGRNEDRTLYNKMTYRIKAIEKRLFT